MLPAALVLLNGPPRCGKDTGARRLVERGGGLIARQGFADPLKLGAHAAHGLLDAAGRALPVDAFEAVKDQPRPEFFGRTPREAYIAHSEAYLKPLHGPDIFGRLFRRDLEAVSAPLVVVPDSGFAAEAEPLAAAIGRPRVLLVRVHAPTRGCSFAGDSRSFIALPGVRLVTLHNDRPGDPEGFLGELLEVVVDFLGRLADEHADARLEAVLDAIRATARQAERAAA